MIHEKTRESKQALSRFAVKQRPGTPVKGAAVCFYGACDEMIHCKASRRNPQGEPAGDTRRIAFHAVLPPALPVHLQRSVQVAS